MSRTKTRGAAWVGWLISAFLIFGSILLWTERQFVVDALQYQSYTPTPAIASVSQTAGFTNDALFTFYATHPAVQSGNQFNQYCVRQEADSPILGCYASNRIYIFDITDQRLKGIKEVTAAHELLHAEYDRLPESEQRRLQPLLEKAFQAGVTDELAERMRYYEKTEPGETINELHSIVGTEFPRLVPELEKYYARYFKDRKKLVGLHQRVQNTFDSLKVEREALEAELTSLAQKIEDDSAQYKAGVESLNSVIQNFNNRAEGGEFASQAEFDSARRQLVARSNQLASSRQSILSDIANYNVLRSKHESISNETAGLYKSLDSTLSDVPTI
jgi:hypothetical protein